MNTNSPWTRTEWSTLDVLEDQVVTVHIGNEAITGRATGVDDHGALHVETTDSIRTFRGGEVSFKGQ